MAALTNEQKNNKTITNEDAGNLDLTWDEATMTWDEAVTTWEAPGTPLTKEAKNNKSLTNETV